MTTAPMTAAPRKMGVRQLTLLTTVNMMGSGIILLPANLAQVGTISILSWLVTTAGATALAYAFARAGTFSNHDGGMGGYAEYAHGRSGNFLTNYTYFVSLLIANVAIALATVGYGSDLLGFNLGTGTRYFATIGVLWLATVLTFGGARRSGRISSITVWGVIIPVLTISVVGWFFFSPSRFSGAWNPHGFTLLHGISASIAVTLFAFLGLESACADMGAVENPKKNVPIAVLSGTLIAAVLYITSTTVIAGIVPNAELADSNAPFGLAFAHIFNPTIGKIVIGMMVISCFGSLFSWQFTIAEVARSSAAIRYFPKLFTRVTKAGAPVIGICVITVVQTAVALMTVSPSLNKQFTVLLNLTVMTNVIPYLLCMAAMIALQKIERVPAGLARKANIAAVLATAYSLYALYTTGEQAMLYGGLVTFAGWMLYGFVSPRFLTADTPAAVAPEVPTAPVLAPVPPVAVLAPTNGDVVRA